MAIHKPGQKFRQSRLLSKRGGKREVVALLSLTAMVDMFTVLVVFLLQNFAPETQFLDFGDKVVLPQATNIQQLKPAVVVTISPKEVLVNADAVITRVDLTAQTEWMVPTLQQKVQAALAVAKREFEETLQNKVQTLVENVRGDQGPERPVWSKVTVRADKGTDFLTVKKVLYSVSEAGAAEINFAVLKDNSKE